MPGSNMSTKQRIGLLLGIFVPLVILLFPGTMAFQARLALAIAVFTVLFWTLEPVPIEYTSILMVLLLPLFGILPFEKTFSAFSGKTVWLVFSGMALSLGITETPLGARLARFVLTSVGSYTRLILSLHVLAVLMALVVPSGVVRVLILMPMVISLLKSLGEKPGSRVSAALILSLVCSTYFSGNGVLTASVPNMVVLGVMESRGIPVYWSAWAFYLFPVIGLSRVACGYLLVRWLLNARPPPELSNELPRTSKFPETVTPAEKKVIGILLAGILLWATDMVHSIQPVYVALALTLICYLPGWGPLPVDRLRQVNFPLLIYIAAVFAVGYALEDTGFSARLSGLLISGFNIAGASDLVKLYAIPWLVVPFNFLMDTAAVGGMLTGPLIDFGTGIGLAPIPTGLSVAIGTGLVFIPYQGAPFVIAYSFRYVRMGQFILLMTLISLTTLLILLPLNLIYWRLIGFI